MDEGPFRLPRPEQRSAARRSPSAATSGSASASRPRVAEPPAPATSSEATKSASSSSKKRGLGGLLIGLLVGLMVGYGLSLVIKPRPASLVDDSTYQAVFSTNGQVYFGKLTEPGGEHLRLENVYYIQPKTASDDAKDSNDLELIKLGKNEVYGPKDEMVFVKEQILYYQNLDPNGKVATLIRDGQ